MRLSVNIADAEAAPPMECPNITTSVVLMQISLQPGMSEVMLSCAWLRMNEASSALDSADNVACSVETSFKVPFARTTVPFAITKTLVSYAVSNAMTT